MAASRAVWPTFHNWLCVLRDQGSPRALEAAPPIISKRAPSTVELPDEIADAVHNRLIAGHMANLLYWLLICSGFRGYPVWPFVMGVGGVAYPLIIVAASLPPAGILFALGWLAGRTLPHIFG